MRIHAVMVPVIAALCTSCSVHRPGPVPPPNWVVQSFLRAGPGFSMTVKLRDGVDARLYAQAIARYLREERDGATVSAGAECAALNGLPLRGRDRWALVLAAIVKPDWILSQFDYKLRDAEIQSLLDCMPVCCDSEIGFRVESRSGAVR